MLRITNCDTNLRMLDVIRNKKTTTSKALVAVVDEKKRGRDDGWQDADGQKEGEVPRIRRFGWVRSGSAHG